MWVWSVIGVWSVAGVVVPPYQNDPLSLMLWEVKVILPVIIDDWVNVASDDCVTAGEGVVVTETEASEMDREFWMIQLFDIDNVSMQKELALNISC